MREVERASVAGVRVTSGWDTGRAERVKGSTGAPV